MSGKLDQPLDDIVKARRSAGTRGRSTRARVSGRKTAGPVIGGITKNTRVAKPTVKASAIIATPISSKILVTGLPLDVSEPQIQEYFQQVVAPVKSVVLTYGANGTSRGIATVVFRNPNSAALAASKFDGTKVDGRPMKIEVIVSAKQAPTPKGLGERIAQPKSAISNNNSNSKAGKNGAVGKGASTAKTARGGAASKRGGRVGRGNKSKPKTADELDAEMTDYFVPKENIPAAATGGDAAMEDQIM